MFKLKEPYLSIVHFRVIPMDSQTTDIRHLADIFHYDVPIQALETLRNTMNFLWRNN